MSQQSSDSATKLIGLIKQLLDETEKRLSERQQVLHEDEMVALNTVLARLDIVEKMCAGAKKSTKAPKASAAAAAAPTDAAAAPGVAAPAGETPVAFINNRLTHFKNMYSCSAEFRARHTTAECQAAMDQDATILSKKNEGQKLMAQGKFCYDFVKANPVLWKKFDEEFEAARDSAKVAAQPPQQVAETHTPPPVRKAAAATPPPTQ